jgi:hypothetical protein
MAAMLTLTCALACDGTRGNEDGPGGTLVIPPEAVQLFGTSSSIAVVQDLEVLPDGRIWLLNSIEPFFLGFGPDGEITHEYGNQGGGPEEFRAPRGLVHGGIEGEAWVFDWSRNSLIRISQPEMDWTEITLPPEHVRPGTVIGGRDLTDNRVRLARLGDEVILPRTSAAMADGMMTFWLSIWGADLLALDVEEESIRPLMSLRDVLGDPTSSVDMSGDFPPFPIWFRLWAVCDEEQLRVYDRLRNEVPTTSTTSSSNGGHASRHTKQR